MRRASIPLWTSGIVTLLSLATLALPLPAYARVRVSVGIGIPAPVVVAPAPVVVAPPPPVLVARPPLVVGGILRPSSSTLATWVLGALSSSLPLALMSHV